MPPLPLTAAEPRGLARLLGRRRLLLTLGLSAFFSLPLTFISITPVWVWLLRTLVVGLATLLVFGLFEQWPARLPRWLARWALQLLGVVLTVPFAALLAYWITTGGNPQFSSIHGRTIGIASLIYTGLLFASWMVLGTMLRQREALVQQQAMAFELERSELARQASDARLRLLQAQVQPHFLFNTLANVRELVDTGSPQAGQVLDSLIAYLRAAVPQLQDAASTLGQELQLVRAYLVLMQLRFPDRLQFSIDADPAVLALPCPTLMLLTLVENAVRHGTDPSEEGGRIDVWVGLEDGACVARVSDSGVGLRPGGSSGTGLRTLRERLQLAHGAAAQLTLVALQPRGACAEIRFPLPAAAR